MIEDTFAVKLFRALQHAQPEFACWSSDGTVVQFKHNDPRFEPWFTAWSKEHLGRQNHTTGMKWHTFKSYLGQMKFELRRDPACMHFTCHDPEHWYCRMHPHFQANATEQSIREQVNINPTTGEPYDLARLRLQTREPAEQVLDPTPPALTRRIKTLETQVLQLQQVVHELGEAVIAMADEHLNINQQQRQFHRHLRGLGAHIATVFAAGSSGVTAADGSTETSSVSSGEDDACTRPAKRQTTIQDFF